MIARGYDSQLCVFFINVVICIGVRTGGAAAPPSHLIEGGAKSAPYIDPPSHLRGGGGTKSAWYIDFVRGGGRCDEPSPPLMGNPAQACGYMNKILSMANLKCILRNTQWLSIDE